MDEDDFPYRSDIDELGDREAFEDACAELYDPEDDREPDPEVLDPTDIDMGE